MAFEDGQSTVCNDKRSRDTHGCGYGIERVVSRYEKIEGYIAHMPDGNSEEVMGGFRKVNETVCDFNMNENGDSYTPADNIKGEDPIEGHGYGEWSGDGRTIGE